MKYRNNFQRFSGCRMLLMILLLLAWLSLTGEAAIPPKLSYQGYLTDNNGDPITGTVSMIFSLYDVETDGTPLWTKTQNSVSVSDGIFTIFFRIETLVALDVEPAYWLEITVNGEQLPSRQLLKTDTLTGLSCSPDQVANWNGSTWECQKHVRFITEDIGRESRVTDVENGLMWQRTPDNSYVRWPEAKATCENLTFAGFSDWRLPTVDDFRKLTGGTCTLHCHDWRLPPGNPFLIVQLWYWTSSDSSDPLDPALLDGVWQVYFQDSVMLTSPQSISHYVWCVRG